jgi:anti-anti-sigma factor
MPTQLESHTPPPDAVVTYRVEMQSGHAVVQCSGSMVLPNFRLMDDMVRHIKSHPAKRIVLDLKQVERIDSVGVGTLSILLKHAMTSGREVFLAPSTPVRKALATSGLDAVFRFVDSVEEGLSA